MNHKLFTLNTHLTDRYLLKNTTLFNRFQNISKIVSQNEPLTTSQNYYQYKFYKMMENGSFLPAGNTLVASEKSISPNCAIFGDICEYTFPKNKQRLLSLWSHSTGLGFQFDNSADPVSLLKNISKLHSTIDLKHRPQRGNFGTLSWDHPRIEEFITCKRTNPDLIYNFNLSITLDHEFWKRYHQKEKKTLHLMNCISDSIYACGDPGLLFIDKISINHPKIMKEITPPLGELTTLVPCGEQSMYTNETCTLGSINLNSPFLRSATNIIHVERLVETIHLSVRFLDNVIDLLDIPDIQMKERTLQLRRIGLGISGFDDLLKYHNIDYDSKQSLEYAERIAKIFSHESKKASHALASEKGPNAVLTDKRNQTVTCLPPTGGISLLWGNEGFSIEPSFQDASNISPESHIQMLTTWQKYIENSISKTVNLPENYEKHLLPSMIEYAHQKGAKCITFYRDNSRQNQPLPLSECSTCS